MWGEHRLTSKAVVYEESIGVPYIIRYDALVDRARRDRHLVLNIDLAPTFAQLAGVEDVSMDGRSLVDLIRRPRADWRDAFLVEHKQGIRPIESGPSFCAVHTRRFVFARYATGENELYPLDRDPQQLSNRAGANRYADVQRRLFAELRSLCDPEPPGFSF